MRLTESLLYDLRHGLRSFRSSPETLWLAASAIAIGIGAATAVFSFVDRMLFRDLPYRNHERMVWLGMKAPISQNEFLVESAYHYMRQHQTVFSEMTSMSRTPACDLNEPNPVRLTCAHVAANFLPALGVRLPLGRHFSAVEDTQGGPRTAILSHGFWRRRFGGDPGVLGRGLNIDGRPAEIIGVLPADFEMPTLASTDVLLPQQLNIGPRAASSFLTAFGRLKPGVSVAQARESLEPLYRECLKDVPAGFRKEVSFHVTPFRERQVRDYRTLSLVLMGCVIAVLLIVCTNVANLLLARAAGRSHEMAVRAALGASRGRLIRQVMTESALLSLAGGAGGLAIAALLMRLLAGLAPPWLPRVQDSAMDGRVLIFSFAVSAGCALLFGLAPSLSRVQPNALSGSRVTGGGLRLRQTLVAAQIALSFLLVSSAGLLLESLWRMQQVRLGVEPDHVVTTLIQLGQSYGAPARRMDFFEQILDRARRLPGVGHAALADSIPMSGPTTTMIFSNIEIRGRGPLDPTRATGGMTVFRTVTPDYFQTLGIPVIRGRSFEVSDRTAAEPVVIVDENLAKRLFPGEEATGKIMRAGLAGPWRTIIGVSRAAKNASLTSADDPEYFVLWDRKVESARARAHLIVRSEGSLPALAEMLRAEIARLDPVLPVTISTMRDNLARQTARPRFEGLLLSFFALTGLLLASLGQFGVVSAMVTHRSREMGVRMALGANPGHIQRLVIGSALAWTAAGASAGLAAAFYAARYLEKMVFGVRTLDALNFAATMAILAACGTAAAWRPARRATSMDPARVLHQD